MGDDDRIYVYVSNGLPAKYLWKYISKYTLGSIYKTQFIKALLIENLFQLQNDSRENQAGISHYLMRSLIKASKSSFKIN